MSYSLEQDMLQLIMYPSLWQETLFTVPRQSCPIITAWAEEEAAISLIPKLRMAKSITSIFRIEILNWGPVHECMLHPILSFIREGRYVERRPMEIDDMKTLSLDNFSMVENDNKLKKTYWRMYEAEISWHPIAMCGVWECLNPKWLSQEKEQWLPHCADVVPALPR